MGFMLFIANGMKAVCKNVSLSCEGHLLSPSAHLKNAGHSHCQNHTAQNYPRSFLDGKEQKNSLSLKSV